MKILNNICIVLGIIIFLSPSCDVVEGPYMIENNNPVDTNSIVRKVLIEEFTGHYCSNCPDAANELSSLQSLYGENVIGIAIHPSQQTLSFTAPHGLQGEYSYDFRTKWGIEIDNLLGPITELPTGIINRATGLIDWADWNQSVQDELAKEPIFGIIISSNMNSNSGTISISIEALTDLSEQYNVVVCLTEDHIINWQLDGQNDEEFYEHNHVLRSILNSTLGEKISTTFAAGDIWSKNYLVDLVSLEQYNIEYSSNNLPAGNGNADGWIANNMNVIAYIYNVSTNEIVQVEELHLTND